MAAKLLEGEVIDLPRSEDDSKVRRLESEVRSARLERDQARNELETARASIMALRTQLMPLHRALKMVFGEIEMVVGDDPAPLSSTASNASPPADARVKAVWDAWKQKLGSSCARVIEALEVHGDLNTTQLAIAAKMDKRTVNTAIYKMNSASLINKNGGRFSLKQL